MKNYQELDQFKNASSCVGDNENITIVSHCLQYVCCYT